MALPLRIQKAGGWYHVSIQEMLPILVVPVITTGGAGAAAICFCPAQVGLGQLQTRHHIRDQGRFKSVAVSPDERALELSRYFHPNPVRIQALGLNKGPPAGANGWACRQLPVPRRRGGEGRSCGSIGGDTALYLGRRFCGLRLAELAREADLARELRCGGDEQQEVRTASGTSRAEKGEWQRSSDC